MSAAFKCACARPYRRSCRHYGKALEIQLEAVGEKHPNVGTTYSNQGAVYFSLGQCAQPSQLTKSLQIFRRERPCARVKGTESSAFKDDRSAPEWTAKYLEESRSQLSSASEDLSVLFVHPVSMLTVTASDNGVEPDTVADCEQPLPGEPESVRPEETEVSLVAV